MGSHGTTWPCHKLFLLECSAFDFEQAVGLTKADQMNSLWSRVFAIGRLNYEVIMQINGSLARAAIRELLDDGSIKPVAHHSAQGIYTRATAA